jgi:septal ring factor EnvC (AmiA/AmiB activator)
VHADVDELENDFNDLQKQILASRKGQEAQEKRLTTLEKTVAAQKDQKTTLQNPVATLERRP